MHLLRKHYARHHVTFKKLKERRRWRRADDLRLQAKDVRFLDELQDAIKRAPQEDTELIFLDESVFSQKYCQQYAWAAQGANVTPLAMLHNEPCIAMALAISKDRGVIISELRPKSYKCVDFLAFLARLRRRSGTRKLVLILDQAPIHTPHRVRDYCDSVNMRLHFTSAYNPW